MRKTKSKKLGKLLPLVVLLLILSTFCGCGKKIHINEVTFSSDTAYYKEKPYTGEIWTDDDKSACFKTKDGCLQKATFFHHNGKEAISMEIKEKGAPKTSIYDEEGNTIDLPTFQKSYMDIWFNMIMIQGQFMAQ